MPMKLLSATVVAVLDGTIVGGARYVIPYNGRIDQLEQVLHNNLGVPLR